MFTKNSILKVALVVMSALSFANQPTAILDSSKSAGQISASPTALVLLPGETGSSTISWVTNSKFTTVYYSVNGGSPIYFDDGTTGNHIASFIQGGNTYVFSVYPSPAPINPLASVTVTAVTATGSITADPATVLVSPGETGSSSLSWSTSLSQAQVWVQDNGGPEVLFGSGPVSNQEAAFIQAGHTYTFNMYAGTSQSQLLDTVTVQGLEAYGSLWASPTGEVPIAPGETKQIEFIWSLKEVLNAEVRYRIDGGPEAVLTVFSGCTNTNFPCGGYLPGMAINEGKSYEFKLVASDYDTVLDSVTVTGVSSYGFADPGLVWAKARTEYRDADIPNLTINPNACQFTDPAIGPIVNPTACDQIPPGVVYPTGNEWQQNGGFNSNDYWIIGLNTELNPWATCNTGPPNMSEPNTGMDFKNGGPNGRYGLEMHKDPAEGFWRAHMAIDNKPPAPQADCVTFPNVIPFLSLGAQQDFGNPTPVGVLNPSGSGPSATEFTARIWDYDTNSKWVDFQVYAFAKWGGLTRGVFVRLVYEGSVNPGRPDPVKAFWNWPIEESYYFPGSDYVFFDSDTVNLNCENLVEEIKRMRPCTNNPGSGEICGQDIDVTYRIDWQQLFQCASDRGLFGEPMPTDQDIPLTGVHWNVEVFGPSGTPDSSALWMSIHDMRMVPSNE